MRDLWYRLCLWLRPNNCPRCGLRFNCMFTWERDWPRYCWPCYQVDRRIFSEVGELVELNPEPAAPPAGEGV